MLIPFTLHFSVPPYFLCMIDCEIWQLARMWKRCLNRVSNPIVNPTLIRLEIYTLVGENTAHLIDRLDHQNVGLILSISLINYY